MDNKERLCLAQKITNAEIYAVKVMRDELKRQGIELQSYEGKVVSIRVAQILSRHTEEVRDMYKKSKQLLADWVIKESNIKELKSFQKMSAMGLKGNVVSDMKLLERDERTRRLLKKGWKL